MIFGIDFDGTIVEDKWPDIGEPKQKVVDYIKQLQDKGHKWVLLTCRHDDGLISALTWLFNHGLYPAAVNDNTTEKIAEFNSNPRKVYADVYIDDHNAGGVYLPSLSCYGHDFTWALRKMMDDGCVTRRKWTFELEQIERFVYMYEPKDGSEKHFRCFEGIGTMITTWLPNAEDMLAEDWYEVDPD